MKVGDLVCHARKESQVGIIVATGNWAGNADVQVKWFVANHNSGPPIEHNSVYLKLLTSS